MIRVDGLRRTTTDLDRSIAFYCSALGFAVDQHTAIPSGGSRLRLGRQYIDLVTAAAGTMPSAARAPDPRFQHAAIVTSDIEAVWRRLQSHHVAAISRLGPQQLPAGSGGVTAFKFRDPDGHPLELIQFPVASGHLPPQANSNGIPTLGIDHFAMAVADVEASTAFFMERLDMFVTARGINRGVEQDRLDGLDDVEVEVVTLMPPLGPCVPHLELLCYRHPRLGRPHELTGSAPAHAGADEIVCLGSANQERWIGHDPDGHRFWLGSKSRAVPSS